MSDEETPGIVKAQIREIKAALVAWVIASSGSFVLFVLAATRNNMVVAIVGMTTCSICNFVLMTGWWTRPWRPKK